MEERTQKTSRKRTWLKVVIIVIATVLIAACAGAFYMYNRVDDAVDGLNKGIKLSEERQSVETIKEKKPVSMLLLGVDRRSEEQGRSDTIIVLTMNPNTNESVMISVPRDTKTEIVGKGTFDKINHAYAFGGAEMAMDSVEKLLDIDIDYVAEVDMKAFQEVIDVFGGVYVQNKFAFTVEEHRFGTGTIYLDGEKALAYTRMRYDDPNGDFGRQERQRAIVSALVETGMHKFSLAMFNDMLDVLDNHARTNLTFQELTTLSTDYLKAFRNQEIIQLEGSGGLESDGIYYWNPSEESLKSVQQRLDTVVGS